MKGFDQFALAMREQESGNNYSVVNKAGYMGAYQFGKERLYDLGYSLDGYAPAGAEQKTVLPKKIFLRDHFLQDKLFLLHCKKWKAYCLKHFSDFIGSTIEGVNITLSGMVAGVHLLGPGNAEHPGLSQFLNSGIVGKDGNGTQITYYISKFSDYDLTSLK
jgi:hypothetical protein